MRDAANPNRLKGKPVTTYYSVIVDSEFGPYSVELDCVAAPIDDQWREIVELVATGEIEDVIGCDRIDRLYGRCDNRLIALANAVDHWHYERNDNPCDSVRDWIESITGDDAFETVAHRSARIAEQRADYQIDMARGK